jgi:hypothetical protein
MKRLYWGLVMVAALAMVLAACGNDDEDAQDQPAMPTIAPAVASPEATELVTEVPAVLIPTDDALFSMPDDAVVALPPQTVAPGEGTIRVNVTMPEGYKLNGQAPFTLIWSDDPIAQIPADSQDIRIKLPEMPVDVPVTFVEGQTELSAEMTTYWCEGVNETLCFVDRATLTAPITVSASSDVHDLTFERALVPPVS